MALSEKARKRLVIAHTDEGVGKELADTMDANTAPIALVPAITTADATDLPSAEALANQCKASFNALRTAMLNGNKMSAT